MSEEFNWEEYYTNLDTDGKKFAQQIMAIRNISNEMSHFLFERSQLYGVVIYLMVDKLGIYDLDVPVEYFNTLRGYGLVTTPNEEANSLKLSITIPDYDNPEQSE